MEQRRKNIQSDWSTTSLRWLSHQLSGQSTSSPSQVAILQWMLIVAIILSTLYAVIFQIASQQAPINALWQIVFYVLMYGVSRTRYFPIAGYAFATLLVAQPYLAIPFDFTGAETIGRMIASIFAIPITFLLISKRAGIILCVLEISSMVVLMTVFGYTPISTPLVVIVASVGLTVTFMMYENLKLPELSFDNPYEQIVESSPDMIVLVAESKINYINKSGLKMLGIPSAEILLGKPMNEIIEPREIDTSNSHYILRPNTVDDIIAESIETIKRPDGTTTRMLLTARPIHMNNQIVTMIVAKPISNEMDSAELVLDQMTVSSVIVADNRTVYGNRYVEELSGYTREELANISDHFQLIHPDDREKVFEWQKGHGMGDVSTPPTLDYRGIRKDGSIYWGRSTAKRIRYQGKPAFLSTTVDITEEKKQINHLDHVISHTPYPWLIVETQSGKNIITACDMTPADWFATATDFTGRAINDLLIDIPVNLSQILELTSKYAGPYFQRGKIKVETGDVIPIEWSSTRIGDKQSTEFLFTLRNIEYETMLEGDLHRYRAIFNMMSDYGYILRCDDDESCEYAWVSGAFEHITGFDYHLDGKKSTPSQLVHPEDEEIFTHKFRRLLQGNPEMSEHRIVTKSGDVRWIREYAYPVLTDEKVTFIYGAVRDITSSIKSEESLRNHALQQAAVAEIGLAAMDGGLDSKTFVSEALTLVSHVLDVSWSVLIDYRAEEGVFGDFVLVGQPADTNEIESKPDDSSTYLGYVMQQNDPVVVRDWTQESRFRIPKAYQQLGIRTSLSVVVRGQDHPFGILSIHDPQVRWFTSDDINFLQSIANIIGTYILHQVTQLAENDQRMLAEALRDVAAVLNSQNDLQEVLHHILKLVSRVVPAVDQSNVMLVDRAQNVARITIRHHVNDEVPTAEPGQVFALSDVPLFVEMIETAKPLVIGDVTQKEGWYIAPETPWIRSYLAAPIFAGEECIGVINLDSAQVDAFTDTHVERLQAFLNQASIAIQNARYAEELEFQVRERTRALEWEQAQLQAILDSTGEGIFYIDGGTIKFSNSALSDMLGYSPDDLYGKTFRDLVPDDMTETESKRLDQVTEQLFKHGIYRDEMRLKKKNGDVIIVGGTVSLVSNDENDVKIVAVIRDISADVEMEEQRKHFIARAAHELRNPVTNLTTRLYIMRKKEVPTIEDVDKIERVIQRMSSLVEDLLDLSQYQSQHITLSKTNVILQTILQDVVELQSSEAEMKLITLSYRAPETPVSIIADKNRLIQVFVNLVYNAINYTPSKGKVEVTIHEIDVEAQEVAIDVQDTGIGISKENQKSLFQPFFRADNNNKRGTGLGLSISKQIVELHGGRIEVESIENEGSRFTVFLPVTPPEDD